MDNGTCESGHVHGLFERKSRSLARNKTEFVTKTYRVLTQARRLSSAVDLGEHFRKARIWFAEHRRHITISGIRRVEDGDVECLKQTPTKVKQTLLFYCPDKTQDFERPRAWDRPEDTSLTGGLRAYEVK